MEETKRNLDDEIQDLLENLKDLEADSEEYSKTTKCLDTLYRLKIDEKKNESDIEESKNQRKFRVIGYVLEGAGIVLPLIFYGRWMKRGFKFEETGTFTSKTFTGLQRFSNQQRNKRFGRGNTVFSFYLYISRKSQSVL